MKRRAWDQLVSTAGVVLAVALIVLGGLAIYGGHFGQTSVRDRLTPQQVTFPPYAAMTAAEQKEVGAFAGQQVVNGPQAEAFARYIAGHLQAVNGGKTYAETSGAARQPGLDAKTAADLNAKADILFKGETLRSILLNAYGWWTVSTIALWAGVVMVVTGVIFGVLAFFGFRHAGKAKDEQPKVVAVPDKELVSTNV
jgi:hypothetical protein